MIQKLHADELDAVIGGYQRASTWLLAERIHDEERMQERVWSLIKRRPHAYHKARDAPYDDDETYQTDRPSQGRTLRTRSVADCERKFENLNEWKQLADVRKGNDDKDSFVSMKASGISMGDT